MATLVELTANIVASHAASNGLSSDELILEINKVYSTLKKLETDGTVVETGSAPTVPVISLKKAFQPDQVTCMICGKSGFKTLTRHLKQAHELKPGQYRKQFNIPGTQSLTAKNYSEARRKAANENNLAANLEKARAARKAPKAAKMKAVKTAPVEENVAPVKSAKSAKPAKATKAPKSRAAKA